MQYAVVCYKEIHVSTEVWIFDSKDRAKEFLKQKSEEDAEEMTARDGYKVETDISEERESAVVMTVGMQHNEIDEITIYRICKISKADEVIT